MATDTHLPTPIDHAFTILGGLATPLMLLALGHTLATLSTGGLWRGAYLALFHLAMPVSVATYLYVEMYQNEHAQEVAGLILISTLLALVVLPLVLTVWI